MRFEKSVIPRRSFTAPLETRALSAWAPLPRPLPGPWGGGTAAAPPGAACRLRVNRDTAKEELGATRLEERSYPGPDYDDSYHIMGAEARTGDNLSDDDSGDSFRGFALMISKLLFSLAQL